MSQDTPHRTVVSRSGVTWCNKVMGRTGCGLCLYITDRPNEVTSEIMIPSSGLVAKVQGKLTCKQSDKGGFLYMLQCTKSQAAYLGESGRQEPVHRFSEHCGES